MTAKFAAVVCVLLALNGVHSSPLGAPLAACGDMTPQHGVDPQTSPAPFTTTVDTTQIGQGGTVHLTLSSNDPGLPFRGFLVIAFDIADPTETPVGAFSNVSNGKLLNCPTGPTQQNAATHARNDDKTEVTIDWTAPAGWTGNVVFKTSYVQETTLFWVKTESAVVSVA